MRTNYLLYAVLGSLLTVSCLKMGDPESYADKKDIFNSESGLNAYSLSFYRALPTVKSIPICEAGTVDYAACRSFSNYYSLNAFSAETSTSWSWSELRNINYFLDGLKEETPDISPEVKNHYEGVARWFRAYFYYDKLAKYGAVPWFDHCLSNTDTDEMYKNRDSRDVIVGHIIEDLDFACDHIMTESSVGNTLISKTAALALKSRVCLFEASWRKYHAGETGTYSARKLFDLCIQASKAIMDSGEYALNETVVEDDYMTVTGAYRSLFYSREVLTNEVILGAAASAEENVTGDANWRFNSGSYGNGYCLSRAFVHTYLCIDGTPFTTKYANYSTKSFKEEFTSRDPRLAQTVKGPSYSLKNGKVQTKVADIVNNVAPTGYHPIKFVEDTNGKNDKAKNENCYPIIRYAEVLLNYAEARAETGTLTDADWKNTVGAIRKRAGITGGLNTRPTTVDTYLQSVFYPDVTNAVILEIRRERAIELVYEGFRVSDLNRWKEGHCFESVPWTGIHFDALDTPVNVNGDKSGGKDVYDYYFTEKEASQIPALYKSIHVKVLPETSTEQGLKYVANPAGGYDLRYDLALSRKWYGDDRQYLYPVPAQIVRDYANRGYIIDQNPGW